MSFRIGSIAYFKQTLKDAVINAAAKYSKLVIITLSVVLLSVVNTSASDIVLCCIDDYYNSCQFCIKYGLYDNSFFSNVKK